MLFCEARRAARRTSDGRFVPLSEQDPATWSTPAIREAEAELGAAARMGRIGRFQLEAAIQSVHADRAQTGRTDWAAIVDFYEHLVRLAPTLGARVAQAAAVAEAHGAAAGLALLDTIDSAAVATYQPFWAVRAHLLRQAGEAADAAEAYDRAIGLTEDPATRQIPARTARLTLSGGHSGAPSNARVSRDSCRNASLSNAIGSEGRNRRNPAPGGERCVLFV